MFLKKRGINVISPEIKQEFSIPKPIINYITDIPENPIGHAKLINCCKYFYYKNQIIVANYLYNRADPFSWFTNPYEVGNVSTVLSYDGRYPKIEVEKFPRKIWIMYNFQATVILKK
uniref:Uncharacterized protein n=1 Tax=Panagrolaimus davidi TaxID=227884 RepID=A0A914QU47_9BILA